MTTTLEMITRSRLGTESYPACCPGFCRAYSSIGLLYSPEGKVRQNWTTFSSPGFGIANFSFLAGKTSYLLITKLGLLTIKMLVLPRLSNFVQFHWTRSFSRLKLER
jgi:hypothetical protein